MLEEILYECSERCLDGRYIEWNEIWEKDRVKLCKNIKNSCKKYVVGALYKDMNELLYSFNKKEEWIEFNPVMINFVYQNKEIIENLNYYKWAKFYEKINEKEEKLQFLLNDGFKRKNESIYRAMLAYEYERTSAKKEKQQLSNTLDLLFVAESHFDYNIGIEDLSNDGGEYEDEMYNSYEKMREYLRDPILLISNMKKKSINL